MNEPQPTSEADAPAAPEPPRTLNRVVGYLVLQIKKELLGTGEVAELRRLDPQQPGGSAFWKVLVYEVEPAGRLRGADAELRWALILRTVAMLHAAHQPGRKLGRALVAAQVSEARLVRLLRADLSSLDATLRAIAHQLAGAGEPVDLGELAWLVDTARRPGNDRDGEGEKRRRKIAVDYYRARRKAEASSAA